MTKEKRAALIAQFSTLAREYHRTGDVVLRRQAERSIMETAPTLACGRKIIAGLYS